MLAHLLANAHVVAHAAVTVARVVIHKLDWWV